jgi:hypothetical protein
MLKFKIFIVQLRLILTKLAITITKDEENYLLIGEIKLVRDR